jgi:integrase
LGTKTSRYKQGTIRKLKRANGFAWEVRLSETVNGKQHQKSLYFQGSEYPTKASVQKAINPQIVMANGEENQRAKIGAKFGAIAALYRREHLPTLRKSTREKNAYLLKDFIELKWTDVPLMSVTPLLVKEWLTGLKGSKRVDGLNGESKPLAATTKTGVRSVMHQCFELAALHGYIPATDRNPMSLVKIKGSTKRERETIILSQEQFRELVSSLPAPLNVMVLLIGCFGFRISELLGLHWGDIDWDRMTVFVQRCFTHGVVEETKTKASRATLPVDEALLAIIKKYRATAADSELMFPSSRTGGYRSASMLLQKGLQPVAIRLGFGRLKFHDLRHSCRSWLNAKSVPVGTQKDLLRHADIATTMNIYGGSLPPEMRIGHSAMVQGLIPESMRPKGAVG